MSLQLIEIVPADTAHEAVSALLDRAASALTEAGHELVEAQVTSDRGRVFVIAEVQGETDAAPAADLATALGDAAAEVSEPATVRLVGAELADVKAARPAAGYLVEWDIPAEITMDAYLARKKANAPKYADVPETSFLRTYVREDTAKCLCFYDAPDTDAVVRAREAVSTPIDRLHVLDLDLLRGVGR
ncbi:DUF4242 domain-containing protein [Kytococcus sp. HMSC28H12]|uniref:DUF4242 domain-containing protein n=1 Tax=Kytococcus sp. HMSC28H12 TaxID=1581067 RepID=UPI0008A5C74F|nr:DUF4242 domain-containing protein [Kytococcus sp. HMSC28H12]OFS15244.1 hypothetical protein HMPREF3099_02520 [Kytococcus sp. HMSC28H12]